MVKKLIRILLGAVILAETIYFVRPYVQRRQAESLNCVANLIQHYDNQIYNISLNYLIRGNFGLVHLSGHSDINPEKIFSRKVSFRLQHNGDIYYMLAEKIIRLPNDKISDMELSQHLPRFFITPGKEIYLRILKQENNNFVFLVNSIPTFVCKDISG